jgi:hypothetical protein
VDVLSTGMLALVSLLGRGVVRYSQRYPGGDARPARYLRKPLQIDPRPSVEYQRRAGASAEAGNNAWVNRFEVSPHV